MQPYQIVSHSLGITFGACIDLDIDQLHTYNLINIITVSRIYVELHPNFIFIMAIHGFVIL